MGSVAERLRAADRAEVAAMSPSERVELALRLGRRDLGVYAAVNGLTLEAARARLDDARQAGRHRCTLFGSESS